MTFPANSNRPVIDCIKEIPTSGLVPKWVMVDGQVSLVGVAQEVAA